jgi:hypothetical protein
MHHSEVAGWVLVVLAVVFVPAMYWIGRGRDPLGVKRRAKASDANTKKDSTMSRDSTQSSNEDDEPEDRFQKRSAGESEPEPIGTKEGPDSPNE